MAVLISLILTGVAILSLLVVRRYRRASRLKNQRRVEALYSAAAGAGEAIQRELDLGTSIDLQDAEGNSALHLAHYRGKQDAIASLVAFGADENLRNREGLKPADMAAVAATETMLEQVAQYLTAEGTWSDPDHVRPLYYNLKRRPSRIFNPALVRVVLRAGHHRSLLILAIKLGVRGSEERLALVLDGYGTVDMATDYLNSGSPTLSAAAERWARRHQYYIYRFPGQPTVAWGAF